MLRALLVPLAAVAAPTYAESIQITPPAANAQDGTARARAEGEALLAAGGAQTFFRNESADGAIVLRHLPSGYRCVFNPGLEVNRVMVFPHRRPGHNVGCTTQTISDVRTLYLTHVPEAHVSEDMSLDVAVAGIRQRFPGATPARAGRPGGPTLAAPPGTELPKARVAVFTTSGGDERVDVGKRGEWLIKYRYSAPSGVAATGGPLDMFWPMAVLEGERWRQANPTAPEAAASAPLAAAAPLPPMEVQRADAARVIEASGATGVFEIAESDGLVAYRHVRSGLICRFSSPAGKLMVGKGSRRMDDAGCWTVGADAQTSTLLRVRPKEGREDAKRALETAVRELRSAHPDLRPATGPSLMARMDPTPGTTALPPHQSAGLEGRIAGKASYARLSAAVAGDWVLTRTSLGPQEERMQAEVLGEMTFLAALRDLGGR